MEMLEKLFRHISSFPFFLFLFFVFSVTKLLQLKLYIITSKDVTPSDEFLFQKH